MTTRSTSASAASALRSGVSAPKRAATTLERTISEALPDSDVAMASGRLNARKSVSGSGRRTRNGRTTRRVSGWARLGVAPVSTPRMARSSSAIASADAGRSAGLLAMARRITRSTAATAGEPVSAGGCSCCVACRTSTIVRPLNAGRPASISKRIAPAAKRSLRLSTASPVTCSGAMYRGVPITTPVRVSPVAGLSAPSSSGRARPKSRSFTPWAVRKTLDGFRSRWTMPRACSAESAASMPSPIGSASEVLSGPRCSRSASDSPSRSSIAMNRRPPSSPTS